MGNKKSGESLCEMCFWRVSTIEEIKKAIQEFTLGGVKSYVERNCNFNIDAKECQKSIIMQDYIKSRT